MCAMTYSYVCHDSFICVPWLIRMCAMTHSYVCHDSFICVPWLVHTCAMTHVACRTSQVVYRMKSFLESSGCRTHTLKTSGRQKETLQTHSNLCHDWFICVTICHMFDTTRSYVWHDSFTCVTWLMHMCAMTPSYVCHDSFMCVFGSAQVLKQSRKSPMTHPYVCHDSSICVTWLIHICDMTHPYVCHDSSIRVISLNHMRAMTHPYICHDSFTRRVPTLIHMRVMTHLVGHNSFKCVFNSSWALEQSRHKVGRAIVAGLFCGCFRK